MVDERDRNVLTHLYRGELTRMLAYRIRLDTTTNWAIGMSAAIVSFGLGHPEIPHSVMLLAIALDLQLLWLEARRFRAFDLSRRRMRLLEGGFIASVLGGGNDEGRQLGESYTTPSWQISPLHAAAHRVRRNYLWLICSVVAVWLVKVRLHGAGDWNLAAQVGGVPGVVVLGIVGSMVVVLLGLATIAPEEEPG